MDDAGRYLTQMNFICLSQHIDFIVCPRGAIRHINPLMFGVIDDKPEGVARGDYHV